MIQTIDLKKGMVFERDGKLLKVLQINHHKPGKGNTLMQMDIQDLRSGSIGPLLLCVHLKRLNKLTLTSVLLNTFMMKVNSAVFMDLEKLRTIQFKP